MKFKSTLFIGLLAAMLCAPSLTKAQAVEQGNVSIDLYYGFPNFMTTLLRAIAEPYSDDPNLKVSGLGPFGARAQYMVSDRIGVGLEFFYAKSSISYTDQVIDGFGNSQTYDYELRSTRPRFLLRMDLHLGNSDMVDPYFAFGLGYSASKYSFITNDPSFDLDDFTTLRAVIPVAYRIGFGTKFYFTSFLGAGVEVGIGGPLITFGLSGKF